MTNAYCTLEDVKSSLAGDVPNMGSAHDQSLVNKILEVSKDLDRKVAECRGDPDSLFSFLADQTYGRQRVYLSSTPAPSDGTFLLGFDGQVTILISWDATAQAVQDSLAALSNVGDGNVSVGGFPGGPWTVDFAGSLVGPQPTIEGRASLTPTDARVVVLPMVQGVLEVPSVRLFRATPTVYGDLLVIDDCVDLVEVVPHDSLGVVKDALVLGVDFDVYPSRGLPIQALKARVGFWDEWPAQYAVKARWGHRLEVPTDVREGAVIESIRSHFASLAGNDDRLGMTPFGSVITSKAFTSKFQDLVNTYGAKLW